MAPAVVMGTPRHLIEGAKPTAVSIFFNEDASQGYIVMSLKKKTLDLIKKRTEALQGGGRKATEKQAAMGKMTARQRILALLDKDSFQEYDRFCQT